MKRIGASRMAVKVGLALVVVVLLALALSQSAFAAKTWCDEDNAAISVSGMENMSQTAYDIQATIFPGKDGQGIPSNAVSADREGLGGTNSHK